MQIKPKSNFLNSKYEKRFVSNIRVRKYLSLVICATALAASSRSCLQVQNLFKKSVFLGLIECMAIEAINCA